MSRETRHRPEVGPPRIGANRTQGTAERPTEKMKLTYWSIECMEDSNAYDIRTKTKREALAKLADHFDPEGFASVVERITIEYADGFDLLDSCLGEGREGTMVVDRKEYPIDFQTTCRYQRPVPAPIIEKHLRKPDGTDCGGQVEIPAAVAT